MPVLYRKQGHTGILTLSRPEARNCWGQDYNDGLLRHLDEATDDDDVRSVILTGDEAGGAFSAGANLRDPNTHNTRSAAAFIKRVGRARNFPSNLLADFPKPVIGAVNGYAIGIGCIITFCCDLVVASDRAEWRLPQVALGILPNYGGATRLARIVGKGLAMRVAMGFPLKAEEAHRIGLAQWLVPHADLMSQSLAIADHIAGLPPLAVRMVKESMNRGQDIPSIADASLVDSYRFMVLEMSEDKAEAHEAWRERRKPRFRGQ
jgi:enoyl-CoA hydratase/carnithine racemase